MPSVLTAILDRLFLLAGEGGRERSGERSVRGGMRQVRAGVVIQKRILKNTLRTRLRQPVYRKREHLPGQ